LLHFVASNVPPAAAAAGLLFTVFRVLAVSHFDPSTALAVFATSGPVTVVGGVLVQITPLLLIYATVGLAYWEWSLRRRKVASGFSGFVLVLVTAVTLFIAPLLNVLLFAGLGVVLAVVEVRQQRKERRDGQAPGMRSLLWFTALTNLLLGAGLILTYSSSVWLPAEVIHLQDGSQQVGYVLQVDGPWTTVLTEAHRQVIRVSSPALESRTICTPVPTEWLSLAEVWTRNSQPPACP
jgi:hypothetical protein